MCFKKVFCILTAASILSGCVPIAENTAKAKPMSEILAAINVRRSSAVHQHIREMQEFIKKEKVRLRSEPNYIENITRMDSLVFGFFCCFCYKNNLITLIKKVSSERTASEYVEDIEVITYILPANREELFMRFGFDMEEFEFKDMIEIIENLRAQRRGTAKNYRKPGKHMREMIREGLEEYEYMKDIDRGYRSE